MAIGNRPIDFPHNGADTGRFIAGQGREPRSTRCFMCFNTKPNINIMGCVSEYVLESQTCDAISTVMIVVCSISLLAKCV